MFIRFIRDKSESGITLIELLVVVALIGVLAGGLLMIIDPIGKIGRANDAGRKSDLAQLQRALEMYYQDYGKYPDTTGMAGNYSISGSTGWGGQWLPYMTKLPKDPTSGRSYIYYSSGQAYYLYAYLQSRTDPQMCFPTTGAECNSIGANGMVPNLCGGPCNYGVTSPNVTP